MSYPYNNNYNWSNPNAPTTPSWIPQHPAAPVPANQVPQVPPPMPFPSNQSQNNVTFKIRFVSDVRRLTLNASIGFKQLEDQIRDLFGDKELFSTHSIKYKDDEGDWVTMSSDLELKEALRLIDNKRLIQLSIEPKNSAVQQVSDALHQMHKDPQLLQSLIQSLTNSRISSPLSASSTPQAGSTSSFPSSPFTPSTPLYSAVNNANKPVDSPSTNNEKKDFAPVVLPQSQSNQSQVWCDGCGVKLLHQSHKCSQCPDYDLCDICYQKRANTKVHHHDSFYNRRLDWGKVPEEKPQTSPAVQVQPPMFSPPSQPPQLFSPPSQPQFSPQQPPVSPFKPNAPVVQPLSPVAPTVEEKAPVPPVVPFPSQPVQTFFAVQPQLPPQPVQPPQPVSEVKSTYKHSARCDVCMKQIIGVRFKCRGCDDFDLCENCYPTRTHTNAHSFDSLTGPEKANQAPAPVEPIATTTLDSNNAWGNLPQVSPPAVPAQEAREVKEENNNNNNQPVELPPSAPQMDRKTIEDGMKQLHDMGFHDRNQNLQALIKSGGNVVAAITSLLN